MFMSCVTPHQLLLAKIACNTNWPGSHKFRRQPSFCLFDDGDNDLDNDHKNYDELTNLHIFCPPPTRFILSSAGWIMCYGESTQICSNDSADDNYVDDLMMGDSNKISSKCELSMADKTR